MRMVILRASVIENGIPIHMCEWTADAELIVQKKSRKYPKRKYTVGYLKEQAVAYIK